MQHTQLLNEQTNVNETKQESGKLIDYISIENTPFTCIVEEGKYYVVMGNYVITEKLDSYEEAVNQVTEEQMFNTILKMILIINEKQKTL